MVFDSGTPKDEHALGRLERDKVAWLTSVTPDGQPQTFPVWFLWEDGEILVYSLNVAKRNENIAANPKVALHLNDDGKGSDVVVIEGAARVDPDAPRARENGPFAAKYEAELRRMGWTAAEMSETYDVRIRVRPTRIRVYRG